MSKAIHEMNLKEAQSKLEEYQKELLFRNIKTKTLNDMIESVNVDSPDLRDCIRILKSRIKELECTH